jgi:hypothetical protein
MHPARERPPPGHGSPTCCRRRPSLRRPSPRVAAAAVPSPGAHPRRPAGAAPGAGGRRPAAALVHGPGPQGGGGAEHRRPGAVRRLCLLGPGGHQQQERQAGARVRGAAGGGGAGQVGPCRRRAARAPRRVRCAPPCRVVTLHPGCQPAERRLPACRLPAAVQARQRPQVPPARPAGRSGRGGVAGLRASGHAARHGQGPGGGRVGPALAPAAAGGRRGGAWGPRRGRRGAGQDGELAPLRREAAVQGAAWRPWVHTSRPHPPAAPLQQGPAGTSSRKRGRGGGTACAAPRRCPWRRCSRHSARKAADRRPRAAVPQGLSS